MKEKTFLESLYDIENQLAKLQKDIDKGSRLLKIVATECLFKSLFGIESINKFSIQETTAATEALIDLLKHQEKLEKELKSLITVKPEKL